MMQLIEPEDYAQFTNAIADMHRLRFRVFKERLDWAVHAEEGMERDRFDALEPAYLLHLGIDDRIQGCARLLPSTGPNMLRHVFSQLITMVEKLATVLGVKPVDLLQRPPKAGPTKAHPS
ncbi:MAG: hypothetical protein K8F90_05965 [Hyphomicrobiales bacterium]|nr:hypothetical protein [Hyphomicrobiales bacterium]